MKNFADCNWPRLLEAPKLNPCITLTGPPLNPLTHDPAVMNTAIYSKYEHVSLGLLSIDTGLC